MIFINNKKYAIEAQELLDKENFLGWGNNGLIDYIKNSSSIFIFSRNKDKVDGLLLGYNFEDLFEINIFYVDKEKRNQGIGSQLLETFLNLVKKRNGQVINLDVNVNNKGAIKLYESFGFKKFLLKPNFYSNNDDAWLMKRNEYFRN